MAEEKNLFSKLNSVDCSTKSKRKNGLNYLSWAWAWSEAKKIVPDLNYKVYERSDGRLYWDDGKTCWVKVGVTMEGLEYVEYLPVMDLRNKSVGVDSIDSVQVNKAIQRAVTKAIARHGLGLYIYAGEDLPEEEPLTINVEAAAAAAVSPEKVAENKDVDFATLQKETIALVQELANSPANETVMNYLTQNFNNKGFRISQTTEEHRDLVLSAKLFLENLKKQING